MVVSWSFVWSVPLRVAVPRPVLLEMIVTECCSIVSVALLEDGSVLHSVTAKERHGREKYIPCCLIWTTWKFCQMVVRPMSVPMSPKMMVQKVSSVIAWKAPMNRGMGWDLTTQV